VLLLTRISLWTLLKIDLLLSITPHLQVCPFQFKIGIVLTDDTYYHCFLLKKGITNRDCIRFKWRFGFFRFWRLWRFGCCCC
jgi:hypothetical protein